MMIRMQRITAAVGAAFTLAALALPAAAKTTLTLASYVPEHSASAVALKAWGADVTTATGGEIEFQFFWAGALLSPADTAQGIADGRADIGLVAQVYMPARLPLSTVDSVPFMTANLRAFGHAFAETYKASADMQAEYARNGLHMLLFAPADENMFYAKAPLNGVADLKDKRIRAIGMGVQALQAVGANPVALSQTEVFEALNKGLLDATSGATLDLGVDFGFHTVAPFLVDPNYGVYASGTYSINKAKYDALAPAVGETLDGMADRFLDDYFFPQMRLALVDRCDKARAAGATIIVWDPAETQAWRDAVGSAARDQWVQTASSTGVDAAAFLADYEARLRGFEATLDWDGAGEACAAQAGG